MKTLTKETLNLLAKATTYIETWDINDIANMYIDQLEYSFEEVIEAYESDKTAYKTLVKQGYKIEEIKTLAQTELQDCEIKKEVTVETILESLEVVKTRKVGTIVKDIIKAESKIEVLQGYCDSYKKGHMACVDSHLNIWEPTKKNESMQATQYKVLSTLDDELKEAIKSLNISNDKAVELLIDGGICVDTAYCMIEDWEV